MRMPSGQFQIQIMQYQKNRYHKKPQKIRILKIHQLSPPSFDSTSA